MFGVILQLTSVVLDHMQKRTIMAVNGNSAYNGFNLDLGSDHVALKSQVSLSRKFVTVLVFFYYVEVVVVLMFISFSMIMTFP